jgi:hypothetical protein
MFGSLRVAPCEYADYLRLANAVRHQHHKQASRCRHEGRIVGDKTLFKFKVVEVQYRVVQESQEKRDVFQDLELCSFSV